MSNSSDFEKGDIVYHKGRDEKGIYIKDTWDHNESLVDFKPNEIGVGTLRVTTSLLDKKKRKDE